jgi:hypothetical protein
MGLVSELLRDIFEICIGPSDWMVERSQGAKILTGEFLVFDRRGRVRFRFPGRIVERTWMPAEVYIYNPPSFAKRHRHGRCLQLLHPNDRWYKLHFERPATDFQSAYSYVEYFLTEAYNTRF